MDRLRRLGGKELTVKMIGLFSAHVQAVLGQAHASFNSNDIEGVERAAHSIKSSAGNVGATILRELAEEAEQAAHDGNAAVLQGLLTDLEEAFDHAKAKLEEERN